MIDETKLLTTLRKWRETAKMNTYVGLKPPALLQKVIDEVERMAEEENAADN